MRDRLEKRQFLVADQFMRAPPSRVIQPKVEDQVKARLRIARRFVFNDKATLRLGEVIRDIPDLLFRECQFARAPYDVTYIEIPNFALLWETIMGREADASGDASLGFLIDHGSVYVITGGTNEQPSIGALLMPISYLLQTPWPDEDRQRFADKGKASLVEIDGFCWGATFKTTLEKAMASDSPFANMRKAHSCRWLPVLPKIDNDLRVFLSGAAGELRNIIAILLLMNRPSLTTYVAEVPHSRGFVKGKLVPYFSHTVVSIDLDPRPILRRLGTPEGEGVTRRRHEARGTWCHDYDAREYAKIGCVHVWCADLKHAGEDDPNDPDHWVCSVCEGKRWWRSQHHRGDASKGFVIKDEYSVSARSSEARARR